MTGNNYYEQLQAEKAVLEQEIIYIQRKTKAARDNEQLDKYGKFVRLLLPVQKQYLRLCGELEALETANEVDELANFIA